MKNQEVKIRVDALNRLVANHKGEDEPDMYKATPYVFAQRGFVLPVFQAEYDQIFDELSKKGNYPDTKLNLVEQLSYGNYFRVLHPEKICGEEFATTSGAFPIKVKGTLLDVQRVISDTIENHTIEKEIKKTESAIKNTVKEMYDFFIIDARITHNDGTHLAVTFSTTKQLVVARFDVGLEGKIPFGSDGYLQWFKCSERPRGAKLFSEITNKDVIRKYLDQPEIIELLKPYYPVPNSLLVTDVRIEKHFGSYTKNYIRLKFNKSVKSKSFQEVEIDFKVDANGKVGIGIDGFPEWMRALELAEYFGSCIFETITDKDVIRKCLSQPEVTKVLKPFLPSTKSNVESQFGDTKDLKRRIRIAKAKAQALILLLAL